MNEWLEWLIMTAAWGFVIWAVYRDQYRWTLPAGALAGVVLLNLAPSTWAVLVFALTALPAGLLIRRSTAQRPAPVVAA